jgi:hypothetical protein
MTAFPLVHRTPFPRLPSGARLRCGAGGTRCSRMRRTHRARLAVRVLTLVGSDPAVVVGTSLYGACLESGRRFRRRELIAIRLPSGGRIKARVLWRFGRRCGVVFAAPVASFAQLLAERAVVRPPTRRKRPLPPSLGFGHRVFRRVARMFGLAFAYRAFKLLAWARRRTEWLRHRHRPGLPRNMPMTE